MSAENPFKHVSKTKETVEKYIVTEGENAGRLKADTPEALKFATDVAYKEKEEIEEAPLEYMRSGTKATWEGIEAEINNYIKEAIGREAVAEVVQEGEELLKEMREHPEYRKEGEVKSGYSKDFLERLAGLRNHMNETYRKSKDEVGEALGNTGKGV